MKIIRLLIGLIRNLICIFVAIINGIMAFLNNVMVVRHKLLVNLVSLWIKGELVERIDRLPLELSPRSSKHLGRCCAHKERAVWKYKCLSLLGFDIHFEQVEPYRLNGTAVREAYGFTQSGGVARAVKAYLKNDKLSVLQIADINKRNIGLLRATAKIKKPSSVFIEVMACEGGCITGPCTHNDFVSGKRNLAKALEEKEDAYANRD